MIFYNFSKMSGSFRLDGLSNFNVRLIDFNICISNKLLLFLIPFKNYVKSVKRNQKSISSRQTKKIQKSFRKQTKYLSMAGMGNIDLEQQNFCWEIMPLDIIQKQLHRIQ